MNDKLFTGYAELTPSYRKVQTGEPSPSNDENTKAQKGGKLQQQPRPTYAPDMAEPRTYLSRVLPQLLQLVIPPELSAAIRNIMIDAEMLTPGREISDRVILEELGITARAKTGSKYSFECKDGALRLVYMSESGAKKYVHGAGLEFLIRTICTLILDDLSTQLRKPTVYTSLEFEMISKKIVYNPFAKIAALLPVTVSSSIPTIVGLLLMDQKMSLVSLSFILRTSVLPRALKEKYNVEKLPDLAVRNFATVKSVPCYEFLTADGNYKYIRIRFDGKVSTREARSVRHDEELTAAPLVTDDMW